MDDLISILIDRLPKLRGTGVIPWGSPVPSFGCIQTSLIATLGLNPSNREFVDERGSELVDPHRRFQTLGSLGLACWSEARSHHVELIADSCRMYFARNPYDGWFRRLDRLISNTSCSYYGAGGACHLDLVPYATSEKWALLAKTQRDALFERTGDALGRLLRASPIRVVVLNGRTVVSAFERMTGVTLAVRRIPNWALPRRDGVGVPGVAFTGSVRFVHGVDLRREVHVLGYNHNIQSSFGVTAKVMDSIGHWVSSTVSGLLA